MIDYNLQFFGGRGANSPVTSWNGSKAKTYHLYHGSPNANIDSFDIEKAGTNTSTGEKLLFFTNSEKFADDFSYERIDTGSILFNERGKKGKVYEVDVTLKNPLNLTKLSNKDKLNIIKMSDGEIKQDQIDRFSKGNNQLLKSYIDLGRLQKYGYDGIIAKVNRDGDLEYGVVNNKQVKIKRARK